MKKSLVLLYVLIGFGLYNSSRLAWREWSNVEACPVVGSVPAYYVAFAGYLLLIVGLIGVSRISSMRAVFWTGLVIAGGLALVGSIMELVIGSICPRAGSIPMCYISLIGVLFRASVGRPHHSEQSKPSEPT